MEDNPNKGKRKACATSDSSSTDLSSSAEITRARKSELLRKARKKAKQQIQCEPPTSIKTHFTSVSKKTTNNNNTSVQEMAGNTDTVTLSDIMSKLCAMEKQLNLVTSTMEELKGEIFQIREENDKLKSDLSRCQKQCEELESTTKEAKHSASVAVKKVNDLEQYGRRNNIRILGVHEPENETAEQCENAVLKLFREKLGLSGIGAADIEAAHRLGPKGRPHPQRRQPYYRPTIMRFVSRKTVEKNGGKGNESKAPTQRVTAGGDGRFDCSQLSTS